LRKFKANRLFADKLVDWFKCSIFLWRSAKHIKMAYQNFVFIILCDWETFCNAWWQSGKNYHSWCGFYFYVWFNSKSVLFKSLK
jgi:hypothetical protein